MKNEQWKEMPGYEGLYEVSTCGQVRSIREDKNTFYGRLLSPCRTTKGYRQVRLSKKNVPKMFKCYRLVALAFIPNPESKIGVNHKNGNKVDDRVENLEWATNQENVDHACANDLMHSKLTTNQAKTAKKLLSLGYYFRDIAKMYGVHAATIHDIKQGKTWKWLRL